jgi:hypothetical protein
LAGSSAGKELNASAWTLIAGPTEVNATAFTGSNSQVPLPFTIGIVIPPGGQVSFLITTTDDLSVQYRSGDEQYNKVYKANANMQLVGGAGVAYRFDSTFGISSGEGRLWNGVVHYTACA